MAIFKSKTIAAILLVGVILHLNSSPFQIHFLALSFVAGILYLLIQSFRSTEANEEKYINQNGYVVLSASGELEHRAIAIKLLGRELYANEVVHHINGRRDDNRITNLCLMDREKHELFHSWLRWKKEKSGYYPRFKDQKRILQDEYGGTLLAEINHAQSNWIAEPISNLQPSPRKASSSLQPISPSPPYEIPIALSQDQKRLLFIKLREERLRQSERLKIPAYMIFIDKTLLQMAEIAPISRHEMLEIEGVTDEKFEAYGPYFIEVVRTFRRSVSNGKDTA